MMRWIRSLLLGGLIGSLNAFGIISLYSLFSQTRLPYPWLIAASLVLAIVVLFPFLVPAYVPPENVRKRDLWAAIAFVFSFMLVLWVIPILVILWVAYPETPSRAVTIAVFFASTGSGGIAYPSLRNRLPTMADKLAYFSFILLVPVGVTEALL